MALIMRALWILLLVFAPVHADEENPLSAYAPLAGHCWKGDFPDGNATDEHCFSWVYGGKHLRDVHMVRGKNGEYGGETIYSWDAKRETIVYRYWNSNGGYSDGEIVTGDDGVLISPEERYTGEDGKEQVFRSRLHIIDADGYETITETLRDGEWHPAWTVTFARIDATSVRSPPASRIESGPRCSR